MFWGAFEDLNVSACPSDVSGGKSLTLQTKVSGLYLSIKSTDLSVLHLLQSCLDDVKICTATAFLQFSPDRTNVRTVGP